MTLKTAKIKKKINLEPKISKTQLETLWKEVIKARAGYKSELSGLPGRQIGGNITLTSHHIVGKQTDVLRFLELDNGICLDNATEHIFGVHHKFDAVRAKYYMDLIIENIGQERYEKLLLMRKQCSKKKADLMVIKIFLTQKLKEYQQAKNERSHQDRVPL